MSSTITSPGVAARAREAARALAPLGRADKDRALAAVAAAIGERRDELVAANRLDLAAADGRAPGDPRPADPG